MKITVWGSRGSICVPGPTTKRYGGNTTCLDIRKKSGEVIIIDAGSGMRNLGKALLKEDCTRDITFLLTHAHWDHLIGFPFFGPAYDPEYKITLCGGPNSDRPVKEYLSHQMEPPYFPIDMSEMKAQFKAGCRCDQGGCDGSIQGAIDRMQCTSLPLNHPNGGYGFKFTEDGKTFVFFSDNELGGFIHEGGVERQRYLDFCRGADVLFHDAQYTDEEYRQTRGWGHSTYAEATRFAIEAGVKSLGLFHHDPDRDDDDLDRQVELCCRQIDQAGSPIHCFAAAEGMEIKL